MKQYFIMDGRANYDVDEAQIIECFEAKNNTKALLYLRDNYLGFDYVLVDENSNVVY